MEELISILNDTGIPYAYDHFAEGESPKTPFICYLLPNSNNFAADGRVYHRKSKVRIELYTNKKNPKIEAQVQDALDKHGIFYNQTETWISSERLYEVLFSFEINLER